MHSGQGEEYQHLTDPLQKLNAALNLAKSMPPSKLKKNLIGLINLAPEIEDNLLQKIQQPMEIDDSDPDHPFLKTEFNRDGDAYRSPFTNSYNSHTTDGYKPMGHYRQIEEAGSVLFAEYVKLYYGESGIGSFYVMENQQENGNFSCGFFAKKKTDDQEGFTGNWDSFNIVDISMQGNIAHYHLQSTVLIEMDISQSGINLTGFLKKSKEQKRQFQQNASKDDIFQNHLETVGQMIENIETVMRQHLEAIYVGKTKEVIFTTRWENTVQAEQHRLGLAGELKKMRFGQ